MSLAVPSTLFAQEPKKPSDKAEGPPKEIAVDLGGNVKLKMVLIPAGEFKMGSEESAEDTAEFFNFLDSEGNIEASEFKDEHPQHLVRITKPFYLGTHHVTRGQFRQFVAETGYRTDAEKGKTPGAFGRDWDSKTQGFAWHAQYSWRDAGFEQTDDHPVINVSWNDTVAFCKWLSKKEGKTYRLPTEAEWEYTCRGGTTTRYYGGDDPYRSNPGSWVDIGGTDKGLVLTAPVGSLKPNAFGLFDMHGNAAQWCSDWYGEKYYAMSPTDDPLGPESGKRRALRGGSWADWSYYSRSAVRYARLPDSRDYSTGFRVARNQ